MPNIISISKKLEYCLIVDMCDIDITYADFCNNILYGSDRIALKKLFKKTYGGEYDFMIRYAIFDDKKDEMMFRLKYADYL